MYSLFIPMDMIMKVLFSRHSRLCLLILLLISYTELHAQPKNVPAVQYDDRIAERWLSLLPNLTVFQFAGNIGFASVGVGWDYGKRNRWETHLLLGYLPHFTFDDDCATITLRQLYLPWQVSRENHVSFTPAVFQLSINTVSSKEFWFTEPINTNYYRFSSKIRLHLGMGSRVNFHLGKEKGRRDNCVSLYYDASVCDLEFLSYLRSDNIAFKELISLGIGVIYRFY